VSGWVSCLNPIYAISDRTGFYKLGVAESSYELQFRIYPKVSLALSFKNLIKEDSYLKSATPKIVDKTIHPPNQQRRIN
jgi:hypothetical protein